MPYLKLEGVLVSDRFEVIGRIGSGPFAETYVARDIRVDGQTAILRVTQPTSARTSDPERTAGLSDAFNAEAVVAEKIAHSGIVALLAQGQGIDRDGREFPFLAHEYVAGGDLSAHGRRQPDGRLSLSELTRLLGQLAPALDHAHQLGVYHRRLRPGHLLLTPDARLIKLAGLGRTRLEAFEGIQLEGLQAEVYTAPTYGHPAGLTDEELRGNDVYALAKICFSVVTGHTPVEFVGRPIDRLPVAAAAEACGDGFLRVVRRATSVDHGERFDSVKDYHRALAELATVENTTRPKFERKLAPEEKELIRKRAQFSPIEAVLAQKELELTTLQVEMREFEGRYLRLVGIKHAELDELEAQIAEENARMCPDDVEMRIAAVRARARANESSAAAQRNAVEGEACETFEPSEQLKQIYRELARLIHPDTVLQPDQKERRHVLMSQVNQAYEDSDYGQLQNILGDWEHSPEAVKGHGPGADLIRTIRRMDQAEERLGLIDSELKDWERSQVFQLKFQTDASIADGRDHLHDLASRIDNRIREARRRLRELGAEQVVVPAG